MVRKTLLIAMVAVGMTSSVIADQVGDTITRLKAEIAQERAASQQAGAPFASAGRDVSYVEPFTGTKLDEIPYKFSHPAGYDVPVGRSYDVLY